MPAILHGCTYRLEDVGVLSQVEVAGAFQLLDVFQEGCHYEIQAFNVHLLLSFVELEFLHRVGFAVAHEFGVVAYAEDEEADVAAGYVVLDVLYSCELLEVVEGDELELEVVRAVVSGAYQGNQMHQKSEIVLLKLFDVLEQLSLDGLLEHPAHWKSC